MHVNNIQEVRHKFTSLAHLNGNFTRKFEWILENCSPLRDDDGELMEDKYEFESRCGAEYTSTIAIYRDMRRSIKIDNINTVLDLIASSHDEERWNKLVKGFKKVDYSTLHEEDDVTDLAGEQACTGGQCEISFDVGAKIEKVETSKNVV